MHLTTQKLDEALHLLGAILTLWKGEAYQLVVCGGSALIAQKLAFRATHDVDVLALRNWDHEPCRAYPFPEPLAEAAKQVAQELRLEQNWLNSNTSLLFSDPAAFPVSFWSDLDTREYGGYLRISFVARSGLILLKLYAALNRADPRDFDDLRALAPKFNETKEGLHWLLATFPGVTHVDKLPSLLIHLGHDELINHFQR